MMKMKMRMYGDKDGMKRQELGGRKEEGGEGGGVKEFGGNGGRIKGG